MEERVRSLLEDGLSCLNIQLCRKRYRALLSYIEELERWNRRMNLVKAEAKELVQRHILDSLSAVPHIKSGNPGSLADIGSGAGLPGVPLAAALPDTNIVLIERSEKKSAFLKTVSLRLGLENLEIREADFTNLEERYDCICIRALSPLNDKILKAIYEGLNENGTLYAYKGRREKAAKDVENLISAIGKTAGYDYGIIPLDVPFLEEERNLFWLRKSD